MSTEIDEQHSNAVVEDSKHNGVEIDHEHVDSAQVYDNEHEQIDQNVSSLSDTQAVQEEEVRSRHSSTSSTHDQALPAEDNDESVEEAHHVVEKQEPMVETNKVVYNEPKSVDENQRHEKSAEANNGEIKACPFVDTINDCRFRKSGLLSFNVKRRL